MRAGGTACPRETASVKNGREHTALASSHWTMAFAQLLNLLCSTMGQSLMRSNEFYWRGLVLHIGQRSIGL